MRWRFFAASVCATETDSTNPMTEIRIAGTSSARIRSGDRSGIVSGGRLCGTVPTMLTPCAVRSSPQTSRVVPATTTTGPALARRSASRAGTPNRASKGRSPLRTQNRKPMAASPISSVGLFVWPRCAMIEVSISGSVSPPARMPRICLIWLVAIRMPEAVMKPAITGWLSRLATKPSRSTPISSRNAPDRKASVSAAAA